MRHAAMLLLALGSANAESPTGRHGITPDIKSFPQASPKEALGSVLKAAGLKRIDYLLAHLADPDEIDARAAVLAGGFKDVVQDAGEKFDSAALKKLTRFLQEGEFETLEARAVVRLKDDSARVVRLRKIGARWYLLNPNKP